MKILHYTTETQKSLDLWREISRHFPPGEVQWSISTDAEELKTLHEKYDVLLVPKNIGLEYLGKWEHVLFEDGDLVPFFNAIYLQL